MYHANQFPPERNANDRGFTRRGTLSIFPLVEESSGTVECIASVPANPATTGGVEVPQASQEARLSVLGKELAKVQWSILYMRGGDS